MIIPESSHKIFWPCWTSFLDDLELIRRDFGMIILEMGWIPDYLKLNRTERDWFDANKKIIGTSNLLWIRLKLIPRPFQSVSKISSLLTVVWSHSAVDFKFSNCSWVPPRDENLGFLYAFGKTDAINRVVISDVYSNVMLVTVFRCL